MQHEWLINKHPVPRTQTQTKTFPLPAAFSFGQTLSPPDTGDGHAWLPAAGQSGTSSRGPSDTFGLCLTTPQPGLLTQPWSAGWGQKVGKQPMSPACVWGLVPALAHLSSCVLKRRMCTMPRTNTRTGLLGAKAAQKRSGSLHPHQL